MATDARDASFDQLRALAMLLGVLFHAALAYSPMAAPFFPTADRQNAAGVDAAIWLPHLFRMPLFFAIAGYFSALLYARRGMAGLLAQRARRIGLVFLIFWPLVLVALTISTERAVATVEHPSALLAYLRTNDSPTTPPGTSHLWFLYYLMLLVLLCWSTRALPWARLSDRLASAGPAALAWLPLLLVPSLAFVPAPHPAPESLLPQLWAIAFYGAFFALGWHLQRHPQALDVGAGAAAMAVLAVLLYVIFWSHLSARIAALEGEAVFGYAMRPERYGWHWLNAALEAYISVYATLACLIYGRALLQRRWRWLSFLSAASYWTYLVHLPLLFAIQYRLMDLDWHWTAKFAVAVATTLLGCLASFVLIRRTWLGRLLGAAPAPRDSAT